MDHQLIEECGSCGADLAPSRTYPWHYPGEDCRAIREPWVGYIGGERWGVYLRQPTRREERVTIWLLWIALIAVLIAGVISLLIIA